MKCNMRPVSKPDENGRVFYRCFNPGCNARAWTAFPAHKVYGYGLNCGTHQIGFGDRVEQVLMWCGITQERYVAWKGKLTGNRCSKCQSRKEWLNGILWLNAIASPDWWMSIWRRAWSSLALALRWLP